MTAWLPPRPENKAACGHASTWPSHANLQGHVADLISESKLTSRQRTESVPTICIATILNWQIITCLAQHVLIEVSCLSLRFTDAVATACADGVMECRGFKSQSLKQTLFFLGGALLETACHVPSTNERFLAKMKRNRAIPVDRSCVVIPCLRSTEPWEHGVPVKLAAISTSTPSASSSTPRQRADHQAKHGVFGPIGGARKTCSKKCPWATCGRPSEWAVLDWEVCPSDGVKRSVIAGIAGTQAMLAQ